MAFRAQQIGFPTGFGVVAALAVAALTLGSLGVVALAAGGAGGLGAGDFAAIRFTLVQAILSAALSVAIAVPLARALARRQFPGRGALITLLGAPFLLPVIVAVLGLLAVFGRSGIANQLLEMLGLPAVSIFGLKGVVLAHVFFNLPLATRLILQGWNDIPPEQFKLVASLGMTTGQINALLERPMLARVLPGIFATILLLCITSFAVALTLGGGPRATTIELAIYQAFLFDFNPSRAALLAVIQFGFCALAAGLAFGLSPRAVASFAAKGTPRRFDLGARHLATDGAVIALAVVFLGMPLVMVVLRGTAGLAGLESLILGALLRSLWVALAAASLAVLGGLALGFLICRLRASRAGLAGLFEGVGYLGLSASPLVIGTGLFLVLFPIVDPSLLALPITVLVNAVMSLPFVLRAILPPMAEGLASFGRLAASLDLKGLAGFRVALLAPMRPAIGFAFGLSAALSMGDLGVIALFADPESPTLPLLVYRLMGAYRMDAAWGAALVLAGLSLALFAIADLWGRRHA